MFTGIVEDIGELLELRRGEDTVLLKVGTALPASGFELGDSVAVNGVCLTVSELASGWFSADVSHETLASTTLGDKRPGDRVHLERALALGGRLGGHLVSGHVDGVGELVARQPRGSNLDLEVIAPAEVVPYLVAKGSVAVDGVSLTVNAPAGVRFRLTLVPHTLEGTLLGDLRPGARLNLEADMLGKYVEHFLAGRGLKRIGGVDEEFLADHGFGSGGGSGSAE